MYKVSVIIPAYNTEKYISSCLDSLVNQTLEDIEVIVVDDGSTDNTLQILNSYAEKYPHKIKVFHKENGGQASARNFGLKYAQGEFLGFVDSDDWVSHNMYELMYQEAKLQNAEIVICNIVEHFSDRKIEHDMTAPPNKLGFAGSCCNKIFSREMVGEITFPEGLWYEDFEFSAKQLLKSNHIGLVHEGLYHYNCREGSTMHNANAKKNKDILEVLDHIVEFAEKRGFREQYKNEIEFLYIDHVLFASINRLEEQDNPEKKAVIEYLRKATIEKYPHYYKSPELKKFGLKNRVIVFFNGVGLSGVSRTLLELKEKIKNIYVRG